MKIAVIGLGIMGGGIAKNILKAGYDLTVHNRTRAKADEICAAGAKWADTPRLAATGADVVISVIGDDAASKATWLGENGAFAAMPAHSIAIECSTLSAEWMREWLATAAAQQIGTIDAPLAGSKDAAAAGTLRLLIGAETEVLDRAMPLLKAFSAEQIHFGGPGTGAFYKLINNMWAASQVMALAEGLVLAEKAGLNMDAVLKAVNIGASSSPIVKGKAAQIVDRSYDNVNFALRWMHKDVSYALRAADEAGATLPSIAITREVLRMALQRGWGDLDWPIFAEVLRGK
ncbi:MAG: NAD(P)-dependent oxidoreductase [Anaerolineae bacterium]|nr:NAD(P)-dependent oxidoreductase [Anaerolineae bacterium]